MFEPSTYANSNLEPHDLFLQLASKIREIDCRLDELYAISRISTDSDAKRVIKTRIHSLTDTRACLVLSALDIIPKEPFPKAKYNDFSRTGRK